MIAALVGGQFGSEGKGAIAAFVGEQYTIHVRVGAANAGHTLYTQSTKEMQSPGGYIWQKHVMQQLPCAAYSNPNATLVLGAGALISPEILEAEIERNKKWRKSEDKPPLKLFIDWRAHVIQEDHKKKEAKSGLKESIGSTSATANEGIGVAQAARAMREGFVLAKDVYPAHMVLDTVTYLQDFAGGGEESIMLEGTQGTGLSNATGFYPYVTSRSVTASALAADCGIGPRQIDRVLMVCRSYPIRVAGNSGPFYDDSKEISWKDIGVDPEKERTTVTKKVRRVATLSYSQLRDSARINSATELALTFADYLCPELADKNGMVTPRESDMWDVAGGVLRKIEATTNLSVSYVGTGPRSVISRR